MTPEIPNITPTKPAHTGLKYHFEFLKVLISIHTEN